MLMLMLLASCFGYLFFAILRCFGQWFWSVGEAVNNWHDRHHLLRSFLKRVTHFIFYTLLRGLAELLTSSHQLRVNQSLIIKMFRLFFQPVCILFRPSYHLTILTDSNIVLSVLTLISVSFSSLPLH